MKKEKARHARAFCLLFRIGEPMTRRIHLREPVSPGLAPSGNYPVFFLAVLRSTLSAVLEASKLTSVFNYLAFGVVKRNLDLIQNTVLTAIRTTPPGGWYDKRSPTDCRLSAALLRTPADRRRPAAHGPAIPARPPAAPASTGWPELQEPWAADSARRSGPSWPEWPSPAPGWSL